MTATRHEAHELSARLFRSAVTLGSIALTVAIFAAQVPRPKITRGWLPAEERHAYRAIGDRLERDGKERQVITGSLELPNAVRAAVTIHYEFPAKLRIQRNGADTTLFNNGAASRNGGSVADLEENLIDALTNDSIEGFAENRLSGSSVHLIDKHGQLRSARPGVPADACSLYVVRTRQRVRGDAITEPRFYCFDPTTFLLKTVQSTNRGIVYETRFSNWRLQGSDALPTQITRYAGTQLVFSLTIQSQGLGAAANDGLFERF